jgi:uncharacterized membrane protein
MQPQTEAAAVLGYQAEAGGVVTRWIPTAGACIEAAGVALIILGVIVTTVSFLAHLRGSTNDAYVSYRKGLARSILLGLELLVAGDIIRTVVVAPNLANIGILAVIVVIRTFLSFTLELEITGRWPWERGREAADNRREAAREV